MQNVEPIASTMWTTPLVWRQGCHFSEGIFLSLVQTLLKVWTKVFIYTSSLGLDKREFRYLSAERL